MRLVMQENHDAQPSPPPKRPSLLLGVFIVGQLVFLFVQNLGTWLQDISGEMPGGVRTAVGQVAPDWPLKKGHVWNANEEATRLTLRWSQVTLQLQLWSLFAPTIGTECVFPALLLTDREFDELPVPPGGSLADDPALGRIVLSDNEPADMKRFVRWGNYRLRRFENNLVVYLTPREKETPQETAERWRDRIKENVSENAPLLQGYLRTRLRQIEQREPPRQVILLMRRYSLKGPEAGAEFFDGPFTMPVARWRLGANAGDEAALDYYNPVTQRFEPLRP
jgi:hypothetical protein